MNQPFRLEDDEDYIKIKKELEPILIEIFSLAKLNPKRQKLKKAIHKWQKTFNNALLIGGKVSSLQAVQINSKHPELSPIIKMFMYLGLVESLGVAIINFIMLLLIARGSDFHIERFYDVPRIIHAETLEDLQTTSISLSSKLEFLKSNKLTRTSKLVNRDLRNKIAHLKLNKNDIDDNGVISKNFLINNQEKINEFNRRFMIITIILTKSGLWENF